MSTAASIGRASSPTQNNLALGTRRVLGTTVVGLSAKPLKRMNRSLPTGLNLSTSASALKGNIIAAAPQLANKLANLCLFKVNVLTACTADQAAKLTEPHILWRRTFASEQPDITFGC